MCGCCWWCVCGGGSAWVGEVVREAAGEVGLCLLRATRERLRIAGRRSAADSLAAWHVAFPAEQGAMLPGWLLQELVELQVEEGGPWLRYEKGVLQEAEAAS